MVKNTAQDTAPETSSATASPLRQALQRRVLLLDGALGTEVQRRALTEADWCGTVFADHPCELRGNIDALVLSNPEVISDIHNAYLRAGADIIETCTFNSQAISQAEYGLADRVRDLNLTAAQLARKAADQWSTPTQPRFVAGSVGPTNKMLSMSHDVNHPEARALTFSQLVEAYVKQMQALIEGGVDALLIETIFDTLNAKAALVAAEQAMLNVGRRVDIMLSLTVNDASGRMLAGQTVEAFAASVRHAAPLSVGMNCSLGAPGLLPLVQRLRQAAPWAYISVYPNAGLPNQLGEYEDGPEHMACEMGAFVQSGLVNIMGGCCGTTPEHIAHMRQLIDTAQGATPAQPTPVDTTTLSLAGLETHTLGQGQSGACVGERCNVAGSRKFLRLINEKNYDEALDIARQQVAHGVLALDVNMDDGMLDTVHEMQTFMRLMASDPAVACVPVMIDSSRFDVIEAALQNVQGKAIVNSISLKEGEDAFVQHARVVKQYGAAVVVMAFDEQGQATTYQRKIEICQRAYRLLVDTVGFNPADIIFDPNILTVATGMDEHLDYAHDYVRAGRWIHDNLPGARVSGGLSNLSFAFRGNNFVREAMHSIFFKSAVSGGAMDMAIMNPATMMPIDQIPADLLKAITDVLFDARTPQATEHLVEVAAKYQTSKVKQTKQPEADSSALTPSDRLEQALIAGNATGIEADIDAMMSDGATGIEIISGPLMRGMNIVGERFGSGEMFLPQVVKTARTMKIACELLFAKDPTLNAAEAEAAPNNGTVLLATVKGDVHDIGKNIVGVVLACNGYRVVDLGVNVPVEQIIDAVRTQHIDIVGLSGLITPSLGEMTKVVQALEDVGLRVPVLVGGATTSPLHTALKIAPHYSGVVVQVRDAAQNPLLAAKLLDTESRETFIAEVKAQQQQLRDQYNQRQQHKAPAAPAAQQEPMYHTPVCGTVGTAEMLQVRVADIEPLIDWRYFLHAWRLKPDNAEAVLADARAVLAECADCTVRVAYGMFDCRYAEGQIIISDHKGQEVAIAAPRGKNGTSLTDYPVDHIGVFALTIGPELVTKIEQLKAGNDDYAALLWQSVADRLAEGAAQYLQRHIKDTWGWEGIRPAVGYPALPDQRNMFGLARLIDMDTLGIALTENGAMYPQASVAGLLVPHPKAKYVDAR